MLTSLVAACGCSALRPGCRRILLSSSGILNDGDDFHIAAAPWAHHRINLVDLREKPSLRVVLSTKPLVCDIATRIA